MNDKVKGSKLPYISLRDIDKTFGHTKALQKMNLDVHLGEIIGLVGPNGAGKSTLIKIVTGVHEPTSGTIVFNGKDFRKTNYNTSDAKSYGIACAYQELSLCTNLTVYENFMINHMDHKPFSRFGWRKHAQKVTKEYLENTFPDNGIDVNETVDNLSLTQKQMIEIAKAMSYKDVKVLILDEPTSSLSGDRVKQLHISLKAIAQKGIAVIYISHKLNEIGEICGTIVVMKGGTTCWKGNRGDKSMHELFEILGGEVTVIKRVIVDNRNLPTVVDIKNLNTDRLNDVSMYAKKGEVIGISGLGGSGQTELILEIFRASKGHRRSSIDLKTGVSYISGDRIGEGIFHLWNVADNIIISSLSQIVNKLLISRQKLKELARKWYEKLKFEARGVYDDIVNLSGGNQQKVLLARGMATNANLILLNDPTSGVDVGAKKEIYRLLSEAKNQGKSIIWHSTEDLEMEQCDRVYVMHEGKIIRELVGEQITVNNIIKTSFKEKSRGNDDIEKNDVQKKQKNNILSKIVSHRAFLAFTSLVLIFTIMSLLNQNILSYTGIELLFSSAVPLVFIGLAQMFVVISGGIDFGSGLALGLVNVIIAFTLINNPVLGIVYIILFILGYAALGAIIHLTKIPALIVTLGASFIWLGIALLIAPLPGGNSPSWLSSMYGFNFPIIPMPIIISILAGLLTYWIVKKSKYGMIIRGFGNNPEAITRAGWSQLVAITVTYALAGLMIAIAGFMLTAISRSGDPNATRAYNMLSFATIILGGCWFIGGIGSPVGVVAAALAISSITALMTFIGINTNLQSAVTGLILIIALAIKLISSKVAARK